jgi:hypothetical protein
MGSLRPGLHKENMSQGGRGEPTTGGSQFKPQYSQKQKNKTTKTKGVCGKSNK